MRPPANDDHQIVSDGTTIWVNHASGYCMARFGRMGIDIHNSPDEQERTGVQCLHCTHGPTTPEHWQEFVAQMDKLFSIKVPDKYRPHRFGLS